MRNLNWSGSNVEALLDTIPVPVVLLDANQSRAVMNQAFCTFLGRNRDFLLNSDAAWTMSFRSVNASEEIQTPDSYPNEFDDIVTSEFCGPPDESKRMQVLRRRLHAGERCLILEAAFDALPSYAADLGLIDAGTVPAGQGGTAPRLLMVPRIEPLVQGDLGRVAIDNGVACDCELYIDGNRIALIGARDRQVLHLPIGMHVATLIFADGHEKLISDPFRVSADMLVTLPVREVREMV